MQKNKLLFTIATAAMVAGLTACSRTTSSGATSGTSKAPETAVEKALAAAEGMTQDELFQKAAEELGDTGVLKVAAVTSRGGKPAVADAFLAKLQQYNSKITAPLQYDTYVDGMIYTTLTEEIKAGSTDGYSCAIVQDGYQLQTKGIDTGWFKNFMPKEWKEGTGVDVASNGNPMTLQYNFKTWMYNNKDGNMNIDNVWDVTDSSFKGKIDTMDPTAENVNMDWLIQLTSDEEAAKLKEAYEADTRNSDVNIDNYAKYGDLKKYSYAFIDRYLDNAVFYGDDGKAMTHLAQTPGNIGWIVYSKILKVEETEATTKKNIVIASLGKTYDGDNTKASSLKGFGGFMYKHYLQVMPNAKYPYASAAFFSLISTNADAYSVWASDVGDYPTLPGINKDRTHGGYVTDSNEYPCLNDPTSDWWLSQGGAVVETPSFIGANYDNVIDFIDAAIAKKA